MFMLRKTKTRSRQVPWMLQGSIPYLASCLWAVGSSMVDKKLNHTAFTNSYALSHSIYFTYLFEHLREIRLLSSRTEATSRSLWFLGNLETYSNSFREIECTSWSRDKLMFLGMHLMLRMERPAVSGNVVFWLTTAKMKTMKLWAIRELKCICINF